MWLDSVQSTLIEMAGKAVAATGLRPGQSAQGVIEGTPDRLTLVVARARVPLSENTQLTAGQRVHVEVLDAGKGLQLRVTPLPAGEDTPARPAAPALEAVVARVLEGLGVPRQAESPSAIVPRALPLTDAAIRSVLSLYTERAATSEDLRVIAGLISQAAADGALPAEAAREASALITRYLPREADDIMPALEHLARNIPSEARIALAAAAGRFESLAETARTDLGALLSQLRSSDGLTAYLQGKGQLHQFQSAVDRVVDRISAGQLQNLHRLDQPYVFAEIPFPADGPVREARVHFFHEGHGGQHAFEGRNASVTLDLSTTKLGDLWITLQLAEGHCSCRFGATSEAAVTAIEGGQDDLLRALERAGYARATVHVALWDGDRLRETARLMRRFAGIDVKA
jgi:hypothetical protein